MNININIPDITRDEVVEAVAGKLLGQWTEEIDHETGPDRVYRKTSLAKSMETRIQTRIDQIAEEAIRAHFDEAIKARIVETVDKVLAEGWQVTNQYGEARGPKVDLKARITELLTKPANDGFGGKAVTEIERQVKKAVDEGLAKELGKEVEAAKKSLRAQLDSAVNGKLAEAVKAAMGIR